MTLTDREFWIDYWENKKDLVFRVPKNFVLTNFLRDLIQQGSIHSALEIGGFPGHYTVFLKKYLNIEASLLDYVVHPRIISELLHINDLEEQDVEVIEADLFNFQSSKKYDLVFSNGLIEHFDDTKLVVEKHLGLLNESGKLFISLPNFRGINGWFQKNFDHDNYLKHNIGCMDIEYLHGICEQLQLKNIRVFYDGVFMIWLENEASQPFFVKLFKKMVWVLGKVYSKIFSQKNQLMSPYIVILAEK